MPNEMIEITCGTCANCKHMKLSTYIDAGKITLKCIVQQPYRIIYDGSNTRTAIMIASGTVCALHDFG